MTEGLLDIGSIRNALRTKYPTLHAFKNAEDLVEIAGTFVVRGASGEELDRYMITVTLPLEFPSELPIVREVGGRIPWHEDRHVEHNGKACVMFPDDRWQSFPEGSTIIDFIDVPVANYFLSQSYFEVHGEWPLGEWGHGWDGVFQYYKWLVRTEDDLTMYRFLYVLSKKSLKPHFDCPCASGKKIKRCCQPKIEALRSKIPWRTAELRFQSFKVRKPYEGPKLLG